MKAWLPFIAVGWIGAVIAASVVFKMKLGKPVIPRLPKDAIFAERRCSGRSLDTPWGRIGGAHNCLMVAVTHDSLVVTPFFPFNLMFLPEIYGLERQVPAASIRDVNDNRGLFGRRVTVAFVAPDLRRLELQVRNPDALVSALRKLQRVA